MKLACPISLMWSLIPLKRRWSIKDSIRERFPTAYWRPWFNLKRSIMERVPRMLGKYEGEKGGPLLLVTAGVHGNEPSGVRALQEVFRELEEKKPRMKGTFIGIAGNQEGLQQNQRCIDEDLNRTWTVEKLQRDPTTHEEKEMQEIIQILKDYGPDKYPQRYFIDCHTTSSSSLPYISVQDVGGNNEFAHRFPVYIVKGFSDIVDGSIDKYFSK